MFKPLIILDGPKRYAFALLCSGIGLGLRLLLDPRLGTAVPYITFLPAVMLSAWVVGLGPALAAMMISALSVHYFIVEPLHLFGRGSWVDALGVGRFLVISAVISALIEAVRHAQLTSAKRLQRIQQEIVGRQNAEDAHKESEERLQLALGAASEGLWDWNVRTGEVYCSPRYYTLLGYEPNEWNANYQTWLSLVHPEDRPGIGVRRAEQIKGRNGGFDLEYRLRTKAGEYAWLRSSGKVIDWNPDGTPARIVGTVMNITERKKLEEQSQQAQRLESIGCLAGGVAHDFNNILTVIISYADMAAEECLDSTTRESLQEILAAAERAASLTHQLLCFSRKQLLQPVVVDLNHVLIDVSKMLKRLISENIALILNMSPELDNIMADPGQLQQIIVNLAVNSRDAMPTGGSLIIETANVVFDDPYDNRYPEVQPGPYVMLAVTDTGTGISTEVQERLFEPFFTTKPKNSGTGLGLATVYGIVRQMDGWIGVYSEVGHGSTFKVYFPRTDKSVVISSPAPKTDLHGSETILIVEDQAEVRRVTVTALERHGYTVYSAADAEQAIGFLRKHQGSLQLVITDLILPGINGRELASQLLRYRPELRFLFMSGYTDNTVVQQPGWDQEVKYLQKPFTGDGLAEKVREILGPHQYQADKPQKGPSELKRRHG